MRKRQASIELARVIACFMVICIHTVTWYTNSNGLIENSLFIRSFITDGVPIFWYIMGFFLFINPNASHIKRFKKTMQTLILPAFAVMVFSQIWQDWLLADWGEVSFLSCLDMHSFDFHNLFSNLLRWSSGMTFGGHFWYIFSYLKVILWVPLLTFVCVDTPKANACRRYLMLLCGLYILNQDIHNLFVLTIQGDTYPVTVYSVITPTFLFILIGYEAYLNQNWIKANAPWLRWCGLIGYFGFNTLKYIFAAQDMRVDTGDTYFLDIYNVNAFCASFSLFIAIYCLKFTENSRTEKVVLHLGSKTLGIYLIHGCIFRKMKAIGIRDTIYSWYSKSPDNLIVEIICTVSYAVLVFLVCYIIVALFQWICKQCKQLILKCRPISVR